MKKITNLTIISLTIGTFMLNACKKKEEATPAANNTNNNSTPTSFTFKVDGTAITADSANAVLYTTNGAREIDVYVFKGVMTGTNTPMQVLEMHFKPQTGSQTVTTSFNGAWLTYDTETDYYDCTSGHFNLTLCDTVANKINGTFDFVGTNSSNQTKSITDGTIVVNKITKQ